MAVAPGATRRALAQLALVTCAAIAFFGYRFGSSNHSIQIPLLKHYADPSLYPGDLLLTSFHGYVSYFFPALAAVYRLVPDLQLLYFALFVASLVAALAAIRAIASDVVPDSTAVGWWACLLFLANPTSLAGENAYSLRLYHASVADAILLWACWLALGGRAIAAMALAGFTFNLHALHAAYVGAVLSATPLAPRLTRLRALAACAVLAFPALLWMLASHERLSPGLVEPWLRILKERSGLHTFPTTQPASLYAGYLVFLALGLQAALRTSCRRYRELVLAGAFVVAGLCAAAWLFSEVYPLPVVLKAQLLRSSKWLTLLLLPGLASQIVQAPRRGPLGIAAVVLWGTGLWTHEPALLAYGLALEAVRGARRARRPALLAVAAVLVLAASAGVIVPRPGVASAISSSVLGLAEPRVLVCLVMSAIIEWAARSRWEAPSVLLAIGLVAVWLLPSLSGDSRRAVAGDPWYELQSWVRGHTPKSAVILTPPAREGFRVFSERTVVVEQKDGTQQFFDASFGFAWQQRLQQVNSLTKRYQRFSPGVVEGIRREYGVTHLVLPPGVRSSLPVLFQNEAGSVRSVVPGSLERGGRRTRTTRAVR